jgi:hypothetical protein
MTPLKTYLKRADELAEEVFDVWRSGTHLTPEFERLLNKAFDYTVAKEAAARHRAFDIVRKYDALEEKETRWEFARAYKIYCDRRSARLN